MKLGLLVVLWFFSLSAWAQVTAIKAGRLIDPDNGTVLNNQVILINGGKVERVGADVAIPAGANVIDLSKMTVLPGLIDCHTHLADAVTDGEPLKVLTMTAALTAFESVPNPRKMLLSG